MIKRRLTSPLVGLDGQPIQAKPKTASVFESHMLNLEMVTRKAAQGLKEAGPQIPRGFAYWSFNGIILLQNEKPNA